MAIYHMQAKVVSRGSGRSAVAASAYMSCSRRYNDYDGLQQITFKTFLISCIIRKPHILVLLFFLGS